MYVGEYDPSRDLLVPLLGGVMRRNARTVDRATAPPVAANRPALPSPHLSSWAAKAAIPGPGIAARGFTADVQFPQKGDW